MLYSLAETAKANNLKQYEYFKYLLEEIPPHMDDKDKAFIDKLMPWSESLCTARLIRHGLFTVYRKALKYRHFWA